MILIIIIFIWIFLYYLFLLKNDYTLNIRIKTINYLYDFLVELRQFERIDELIPCMDIMAISYNKCLFNPFCWSIKKVIKPEYRKFINEKIYQYDMDIKKL